MHLSLKFDRNLFITTLKCIWKNYTNKEAMEITSSSGTCKAKYRLASYAFLFGKTK